MSQSELWEAMEKISKPLSRSELSDLTGLDPINVSKTLKRMIKFNEVAFIEIDRNKAKELYGNKAPSRRMKLYFILNVS